MNVTVETNEPQSMSVFSEMAQRFGMDRRAFESTLMATVMPVDRHGNKPSREQVAAFLLVAKKYALSPFTRELYAFPTNGGIQPIVSIDGWMKIINDHPQFDGMTFVDQRLESGELESITCKIYRKDRAHPVEVTEYMRECKRGTDPWKTWPARMLRHKTAIQAARYAFGFSGIMEPDEAERIGDAQVQPVVDMMPRAKAQRAADAQPEVVVEDAAPVATVEVPKPLNESLRRILVERARVASVSVADIEQQYGEITTANLQDILNDLRAMTQGDAT